MDQNEKPHTPAWHYAEADRLLRRAQELSEKYSNTSIKSLELKTDLQGMGRLLTDRAHAHAALAQTDIMVSEQARTWHRNRTD
jgi:hypothetical protein